VASIICNSSSIQPTENSASAELTDVHEPS